MITRLLQKPLMYTVTYVFAAGFSKFLETARKNLWFFGCTKNQKPKNQYDSESQKK